MPAAKKSKAPEAAPDAYTVQLPQTHTLRLEERFAAGKALRERAARKSHAEWKPPASRTDPVDF